MFTAIAKGLGITFKHMLPGHSTTVQYPAVKLKMSDRFRGLHRLVPAQQRSEETGGCGREDDRVSSAVGQITAEP